MTEHCSNNTLREDLILGNLTPDSLTGMIMAMEGIHNTVVLLNGPMGCKFYHSTTSQYLALRPILYLPAKDGEEKIPVSYNFLNDWFFRQSRVPCTYLDSYDYVYGTGDKVAEGLTFIKDHIDFELMVIVNSPGASLIGDNLKEIAGNVLGTRPVVFLESPGFSEEFFMGHDLAMCELLRQVAFPYWEKAGLISAASAASATFKALAKPAFATTDKPSVNLLGMSTWQRFHEGSVASLKADLALLGIEVNLILGSGHDLKGLYQLPKADLNVVIYPELGLDTAKLLETKLGMPYLLCEEPPIGFYGVEQLAKALQEHISCDGTAFWEAFERGKAKAWYYVNQIYQMSGRPNGAYYAMEGMCSELQAYVHFLTEYLGMIPDSLWMHGAAGEAYEEKLKQLLLQFGAGAALEYPMEKSKGEIVLGNANTIARMQTTGHPFCGIEISLPGMGYTDLIPKSHMGIQGTLFLIEQILNGLISRI